MKLKSEREIMSMSKKEREKYLKTVDQYVFDNGGSLNARAFPDFRADVSGEDYECPNCSVAHERVSINTTDHGIYDWIEHVICINCGKFHNYGNGVL